MGELGAGAMFAGYRVVRKLGAGGMGQVYLVDHPRLPRREVLKILAEEHLVDHEFRERFLREADLAVRVRHPNLVDVHDRGTEAGQPWLAMRYIEGTDVARLIAAGPAAIPPERALWIVAEAAKGLDAVHDAGMVHRDVKPANILLEERPDAPPRVLVTDFGIARAVDESHRLTETGTVLASLPYAAPEQFTGDELDRRVDVYGLGCTLYQMLTGSVPFPRDSVGEIMHAHLTAPPPRPRLADSARSTAIAAVIATAMAKDPGDRFPTCGELAAAAAAAWADPIDPGRSRSVRRRAGYVIAALVVCAGLAGAWIGWGGWHRVEAGTATPEGSASDITASWGRYRDVAEALPGLVSAHPQGTGYQDSTCRAVDENYDMLSLSTPVPVARLTCFGSSPVRFTVTCNTDRSPFPHEHEVPVVAGTRQWTRESGTGHLTWGRDAATDGSGLLVVTFDDTAREFCRIRVSGTASGDELLRAWWREAPL
ncbi:serine/threonine-protein kinase [Nocardia sp. NPDC059177]|uniref:serine/threonine-protein kinase n=1 Tax=Nocardia sp. NPDC059177 TaxID=3346759 RepID=UPI0036A86B36